MNFLVSSTNISVLEQEKKWAWSLHTGCSLTTHEIGPVFLYSRIARQKFSLVGNDRKWL